MFSKVAILFATLVAANATLLAPLAHTGTSVTSRHQDAFGNYASNENIVDAGHASVKSRSEVGDGYGNRNDAYSSRINHVAPAAPLAVAHAAPLAYAAPLAHAAPLAVAAGAPIAAAYGAPFAHAAPLAVAAPVAYSSAVNHVAPAVAGPLVAGHGLLGAGHLAYGHGLLGAGRLAYGHGIAGHGLLAHHL